MKKSFSLIEIIIVVTIISAIVAIVAPRILGKGDESKVNLTKSELTNLLGVMELYKLNTGQLPEGLDELVENTRDLKGWKQQADSIPVDQWNNEIIFEKTSNNRYGFQVMSLGADGQPGGEGVNADIIVPEVTR
jgi:general secretion pathway protein G